MRVFSSLDKLDKLLSLHLPPITTHRPPPLPGGEGGVVGRGCGDERTRPNWSGSLVSSYSHDPDGIARKIQNAAISRRALETLLSRSVHMNINSHETLKHTTNKRISKSFCYKKGFLFLQINYLISSILITRMWRGTHVMKKNIDILADT